MPKNEWKGRGRKANEKPNERQETREGLMERIRSRPTLWWETRGSGDVDDCSALDLDSLHLGLALCYGLPLPHNRTRRLKLDGT